jgi:hypothetical protein
MARFHKGSEAAFLFTVRLISVIAAVAGVALAFGVAIGWFAHGRSLGGV